MKAEDMVRKYCERNTVALFKGLLDDGGRLTGRAPDSFWQTKERFARTISFVE